MMDDDLTATAVMWLKLRLAVGGLFLSDEINLRSLIWWLENEENQ